jgi:lysophospholipase L1-like esterase
MSIRTALLTALVAFCPALAHAQLVDDFTPPAGRCCIPATAQTLADQLQDWNQLGRYHAANEQLMRQPADPGRVVFMGDSITDGWKLDQQFPGKAYVNRGISGQTTPQMLVRMFPDVINLKPAALIVLAGTNDIARNTGPTTLRMIEDNIQAITELAQAHGIKVILCSVTPIADYGRAPQSTQRPPADILKMNDWLKAYAAKSGAIYADYYSVLVDAKGFLKDGISADGLHPNATGYNLMAPIAEAAIQKALGH